MKNPFAKLVHPDKYVEKLDIKKVVAAAKFYRKGVDKYKEKILAGEKIRPIVVLKHPVEDLYAVLDGHHRFYAFLESGFQTVEVAVMKSNKFLFEKTKSGWLQPTPKMTKYIHIPTIVLARYVNNFVKSPKKLAKSTKSALTTFKTKISSLRKKKMKEEKKVSATVAGETKKTTEEKPISVVVESPPTTVSSSPTAVIPTDKVEKV